MCALVAGDPFAEATVEHMQTLADAGADVLELLVPFSDPTYHGPVIRRGFERALREDISWTDVEAIATSFRETHETPLIISSYYNPILAIGEEQLARRVGAIDADGVMVADLPWDESDSLRAALEDEDVPLLPMVAPTTPAERIEMMASESETYFVWTGHSGGELTLSRHEFEASMATFRERTDRPVVASMKISTGEEAGAVAAYCDGILVGSAIVWLIEGRDPELPNRLAEFVGDLRASLED
jgi:tryptophan synthase alpha chain